MYKLVLAGPVCNGQCCDESAEKELSFQATSQFDKNLRHHTHSLRTLLESTAKTFSGKSICLSVFFHLA